MTDNLKTLLNEADSIKERITEASNQIAKIADERDKIIAAAKGPNDERALQRLNVLASQEQIVNSQLRIAQREENGVKARLLNEAGHVRQNAIAVLEKEKQRRLSRLDAKLQEFYPDAADRQHVIESLHAGSGIRQIPALQNLGRHLTSLSFGQYNRREQTEVQWATSIFTSVNAAISDCLETN